MLSACGKTVSLCVKTLKPMSLLELCQPMLDMCQAVLEVCQAVLEL